MSEFWKLCNKVFLEIRKLIRYNLQDFGKEVLLSKIPSGNDKGKQVRELLGEHRLNNDHMQRICDDSVKYNVADSGDCVTFELDSGIMVVSLNLNKMGEFASLNIPSFGLVSDVKLR